MKPSELNGASTETVLQYSMVSERGTMNRHEIQGMFIELLNSELFEEKVVKYTQRTCDEILDRVLKQVRGLVYPLAAVIISLIIYIFTTTSSTLAELDKTSESLKTSVALFKHSLDAMDSRSSDNADAIRYLLESK